MTSAALAIPVDDAEILATAGVSMILCVPRTWSVADIETFANRAVKCGETVRWKLLYGDPACEYERHQCQHAPHKTDFVHVVVSAC